MALVYSVHCIVSTDAGGLVSTDAGSLVSTDAGGCRAPETR